MVDYLKRHGATVDAVLIENVAHGAIADRLQAEAHALGADLIKNPGSSGCPSRNKRGDGISPRMFAVNGARQRIRPS